MKSIALSLIGRGPAPDRDHARAFTDSARGPRGEITRHPLDGATGMKFCFRRWNPEYTGPGEDLERVVLLLNGDELPDIGLKPSVQPTEQCYRIPRLVVFRESLESYCMRAVCLAVPTEFADAFETELEAVKQYLTAGCIIGAFTSIAVGRRENENPPLSYAWDPYPINSSADCTDVFVFLQVNLKVEQRRSCRLRLKKHYIFDDIVREDDPSEVQFTSFADLWPLFEEISLVPHR